MTVLTSVPAGNDFERQLTAAEPDMVRAMVKSFAEALMSAEADAICAAEYVDDCRQDAGQRTPGVGRRRCRDCGLAGRAAVEPWSRGAVRRARPPRKACRSQVHVFACSVSHTLRDTARELVELLVVPIPASQRSFILRWVIYSLGHPMTPRSTHRERHKCAVLTCRVPSRR